MRGIDFYFSGRHGCIDDPEALIEFYRRLSIHPDFKPRLGTIQSGVKASVRPRLIQTSPDEDPELVEEVRRFERELKEKGSEDKPNLEPPVILFVGK